MTRESYDSRVTTKAPARCTGGVPTQTFWNLSDGKRMRVRRAAVEEFASHPFADANLDRIARAARVPKGSLYQYFADKDDLYAYAVESGMAEAKALFDETMTRRPPRDAFDLYLRALIFPLTLRRQQPALARLYARSTLAAPPGQSTAARHHNAMFQAQFFGWGVQTRTIASDIDREAAGFLLDAVSNRLHTILLDEGTTKRKGREPSPVTLATKVVELLRRAFAPGPDEEAAS